VGGSLIATLKTCRISSRATPRNTFRPQRARHSSRCHEREYGLRQKSDAAAA
jgi:hypothetical protein